MPDLVLEVGTEDMPAGAVAQALEQLRVGLRDALADARLTARDVTACGTMRRLIAIASDVPECQPDQAREVRGPARSVAYDSAGNPTGAAVGFARKQGVPVEALGAVQTPQGEYVLARVTDVGRPAAEVLGPAVAEIAYKLAFPKMMRWGGDGARFVRPLRWVVALHGTQVVPLELRGVRSGAESRGHRFLAPEPFTVGAAADLVPALHNRYVECDVEARRASIRSQSDALAQKAGGVIPWDEDLLDENTWLVEWPTATLGSFDPVFLDLPRPVLVTAMKKHQRFFPVEDAGGKLLPCFVAIRNGSDAHMDTVREGYERVLTSRFSDARYFHSHDSERSLDDMSEGLGRLVFQEKLGTMMDKRQRLERLVAAIAKAQGTEPGEIAVAVRAARVCKADLVSQMVVELPSLQGIMGREYALSRGEDARVADAIADHYRPRSAGDTLPDSQIGALLAVADRVDTLAGYVGLGILPSGSSDPYGLRRAAQGLVQILARDPDALSLGEMAALAFEGYREVNGLDLPGERATADLLAVLDQRIAALLGDQGVRYDIAEAVLGGGGALGGFVAWALNRGSALQALLGDADFTPTVQAAARVANIVRSADATRPAPAVSGPRSVALVFEDLEAAARSVDQRRFADAAEHALFDAAYACTPEVARYASDLQGVALYHALQPIQDPVNRFFDAVLVMCDDMPTRQNRLSLLSLVDALYRSLADFTKVVDA